MAVLEGIKPERVFYYFEKLTEIPRGSHHTKEVSDYLVAFAKEHTLFCIQDESNNVIIKKPASPGYEQVPVVILQGHSDMVCEKTSDSRHDFTKDPLEIFVAGDFIGARNTTLGADDGIAVAYALAILEDDSLKHPALEVVITADEEVGLLGAAALDMSSLKGNLLINMDSEAEGCLWVGCAGGVRTKSRLPMCYLEAEGICFEVVLDGLKGGHSGAEIDKIRGNAVKLMGRFLYELDEKIPYAVAGLEGGFKDNAIPRSASARLVIERGDEAELFAFAKIFERHLREEYSGSDEEMTVTVREKGEGLFDVLDLVSKGKLIFLLTYLPAGVEKMSGNLEGLVETSSNPGVLTLDREVLTVCYNVRSSVESAKEALAGKIKYLTEFLGGEYHAEGNYPAWKYQKNSKLRELMKRTYLEELGTEPEVKAIHAGLECGLFFEKLPELDCVSFGPNMEQIHTTEERLSISSTERMYRYLIKVLENMKDY
jgi:dipeptidase D